ncbi:MAG TPA: hypothetical protein VK619_03655 [Pyrinomonadaceae bacterium]|nr:hypothetical protein [Pyrinomonadaceae bacterium]
MPKTKNQAKNRSRFEVRGGVLNEFEFARNEGEMTEEERDRLTRQEEEQRLSDAEAGEPPQTEAERIEQMMADARREAERRLARPNQPTVSGAHPGTAKKSAKKRGGKASTEKRAGAVTGASKGAKKGARESSGKKAGKAAKKSGGAKKSAARKSSSKRSAGKSGKRSARKS